MSDIYSLYRPPEPVPGPNPPRRRLLASALILIFGALPASWLGAFASLLVAMGFTGLLDRPPQALLMIAWGGAGVCGALALWFAAFRPVGAWVAAGLLAGCAAMLPLTVTTLGNLGSLGIVDLSPLALLTAALHYGPMLTAVALLGQLAWRAVTGGDGTQAHDA